MGRKAIKKSQLFDIYYRPEYFDRHYQLDAKTGCWNWDGPSHRQGYGMIGAWRVIDDSKIMTTTHRIMARRKYQRAIDSDEWIIHTCSNPRCVNPDHIELGDRQDIHKIMRQNNRYNGRGRPPGTKNKKKTVAQ